MKCNFIKILLAFVLVSVVISLSTSQMDNMIGYSNFGNDCWSCNPSAIQQPSNFTSNTIANNHISSPLALLFQIMFILFFISPPIIAFMLFLIWKELKERNKMK